MPQKIDAQKLSDLHQKILDFTAKRGWNPPAQNLAKSVMIESAELLEHFQWDTNEDDLKKKNSLKLVMRWPILFGTSSI
jgi:hypothetical protein